MQHLDYQPGCAGRYWCAGDSSKTSAAGIFTFEDNQKGDYVLDVAPEPTKKNKAVKAGKMTLEELQVRQSLLC